ncbi:MAG: winged helix-turn-helix transcriptional regulator, partial [Desulfovibrio sp.]|nr:winged helix-turn-helix transcriptional regulator [Desulfovibrio sp.]
AGSSGLISLYDNKSDFRCCYLHGEGSLANFYNFSKLKCSSTTRILAIEGAILALIRQDGGITIKAMADRLNLTAAGVRYHIDRLKRKGILRRIGTYSGRWEII